MVRKNPAYKSTRVVMMTALKDEANVKQAYEVGADGYITKPFQEADLLSAVNQHLTKKSAVVGLS